MAPGQQIVVISNTTNIIFLLACKPIVDLGFIVDGSHSVKIDNFLKCKKFIKDVVKNFNISQTETHVGVVSFSRKAELIFNFKQYYTIPEINNAVDKMPYAKDTTNILEALQLTKSDLIDATGRSKVKQVLVFMTDGKDSHQNENAIPGEAQKLKDTGVNIISLGLGDKYDLNQLKAIASEPSKDYVFTSGFDQLDTMVKFIKDQVCTGKLANVR